MGDSILLIGGGGREHALAWKLSQSPEVDHIYVAPGIAGTEASGKISNCSLDVKNHEQVSQWCKSKNISLVVVEPEDLLANGLSDALAQAGIPCFGPCKKAAQIEASKEFAKLFMDKYQIPTARWKSFTNADEAKGHILNAAAEAKSAWDALKDIFEPKSRESVTRLLDEFFNIKFDPDTDSESTFIARIKSLKCRLNDAGHSLKDEMHAGFQAIRSLPPEYQGIVQMPDSEFTLEKIEKELLAEENRELLNPLKLLSDGTDGSNSSRGSLSKMPKPENKSINKVRWTEMPKPENKSINKARWTKTEDEELKRLVATSCGDGYCTKIASFLLGRSDVGCQQRWSKVRNPNPVRGPWTKKEDELLTELVKQLGPRKWTAIARHFNGRIGKQCRERWHNHLSDIKKFPWTFEEERLICEYHRKWGNQWAKIAKLLPGRSDNDVKNHFNCTLKKRIEADKSLEIGHNLHSPK